MDKQRRRLTVSHTDGPPLLDDDSSPTGGGLAKDARDQLIEDWGVADLFNWAEQGNLRAIALLTMTDRVGKDKGSKEDKDEFWVSQPPNEQWLQDALGVGWACRKGCKPEACNQDCLSILAVEDMFEFLGVYDGHGPYGHDVSEFVCRELPKKFLKCLGKNVLSGEGDIEAALKESFLGIQAQIKERMRDRAESSGTTVTIAYHSVGKNKVWLAHVGDSRAVLGNADGSKAKALTVDHKPDLEGERRRIEQAGGRVIFDGYFNHRVFAARTLAPGLNMSRALGDIMGHEEAGLSAEPEVLELDLARDLAQFGLGGGPGGDVRLVLCTDGVWEFIEDSEAFKIMARGGKATPNECIRDLTDCGWRKWMEDSDNEIADDITGILIPLRPRRT
mmetsp:Transcript_59817/g.182763  ORF Transcript_59817/g.182763 Transcript_59817/m.182763 type:complete len:390 (-) Transcript_59817:77-1246(-)